MYLHHKGKSKPPLPLIPPKQCCASAQATCRKQQTSHYLGEGEGEGFKLHVHVDLIFSQSPCQQCFYRWVYLFIEGEGE